MADKVRPNPLLSKAPVLPVRDTVHFPGVIQTLLVGRDMSVNALHNALKKDREVVVLAQRDQSVEEPAAADLFDFGTLSEVLHVLPLPDGTMRVVLRGMTRITIQSLRFRAAAFSAEYEIVNDYVLKSDRVEALMRESIRTFKKAVELGLQIPPEVLETTSAVDDPSHLADIIAHHLPGQPLIKQELLEETDVELRLQRLVHVLSREHQVLDLQASLRSKVEKELGQTQREYFLREQLRAIQAELGGEDTLSEEGLEYKKKLEAVGLNDDQMDHAMQELKRLERSSSSSPEGMVIRNYLDWLAALPWSKLSEDAIDINKSSKVLNQDHYGLDKVKDRILDFLAVRQVSQALRGPILCFVGPPGVGKTSIGRSIAASMGREFHRISLGGVRDEAEIRGHRRTYIGSMPGRIVQGLKQCGTRNPVFMLDEIDKMTMDFRGDPTSALLEALDPEQNNAFSDHYIELPFDLSSVMFIATANLLENIPPPLRDRMEIIRFPSYTEQDKLSIASKYLVRKQIAEHGLKSSQLKLGKSVLQKIIREYTREAGVRSLERDIAALCRKTARAVAEKGQDQVSITSENLSNFLGRPRFRYGSKEAKPEIGHATGLVYSEYGGDIVAVEAILTQPYGAEPTIRLTGSLGDVMKESAYAAMTYIRANQECLHAKDSFFYDIHLHVPEGAVPKDGPSAGVTILTAIASAYTRRPVRPDTAMTGEITLRGKVLPVGGIREKLLAAHRAGIRRIILPAENERDLDDIPADIRKQMSFEFVSHAKQVLAAALV